MPRSRRSRGTARRCYRSRWEGRRKVRIRTDLRRECRSSRRRRKSPRRSRTIMRGSSRQNGTGGRPAGATKATGALARKSRKRRTPSLTPIPTFSPSPRRHHPAPSPRRRRKRRSRRSAEARTGGGWSHREGVRRLRSRICGVANIGRLGHGGQGGRQRARRETWGVVDALCRGPLHGGALHRGDDAAAARAPAPAKRPT
mmetsp:Transcript_45826/g.147146  ORF Transcript_45826/g.147146 Transcript_45826/m.147146 type:complete len:200 (-) Transcript_45826:934-1533(-)